MKKFYSTILIVLFGVILYGGVAFQVEATYRSVGTITSTNLLDGNNTSSITGFYYNLSSLPGDSSVSIQFSQNGTSWYSASGTSGGSTTLSTLDGDTVDLSSLGWSGSYFYYRLTINATSDRTQTPVIDEVRLNFTSSGGNEDAFYVANTGDVYVGITGAKFSVKGGGTFGSSYFSSTPPTNGLIVEGNIGVGTTSPSYKLDISGTIRQTAVTSSLLKADAGGALVSAIPGTDYLDPSSLNLYVPYTNATADVDLGVYKLTTTGTITGGQLIDSGLTSGYLPYVSVSKQLVDSLLYTDGSAFGVGTTSLSGTKFKVSLDSISASDSYSNEEKIASSSGTVVSGGSLQLYDDGVCGSYTVTGQDGLTYGTVLGADGNCWLDRNLGATQVATSSTDTASYGDLYQWGRLKDGHQVITSGTTSTLSTTDNPGHDDFILDGNTSPYDWRSPQNNALWQGVNGTNNVCPAGFRLPTRAEWSTLVSAENITNSASAFSSSLKLPVAGYRYRSSGGVYYRGSSGYYWSSSVTGVGAYYLYFYASAVNPAYGGNRASGFSVRCVKD